jgi:hypothetical protein
LKSVPLAAREGPSSKQRCRAPVNPPVFVRRREKYIRQLTAARKRAAALSPNACFSLAMASLRQDLSLFCALWAGPNVRGTVNKAVAQSVFCQMSGFELGLPWTSPCPVFTPRSSNRTLGNRPLDGHSLEPPNDWTPDQVSCSDALGGVLKSYTWKAAASVPSTTWPVLVERWRCAVFSLLAFPVLMGSAFSPCYGGIP